MNRMRKTITALALCLLAVLPGTGLVAADEPEYDEKVAAPKAPPPAPSVPGRSPSPDVPRPCGDLPVPIPAAPGRQDTVIIVPSPSDSGRTAVPMPPSTQETPAQEKTGIPPHPSGTSPPDQSSPVEIPVIPVLPDRTSPVEIPVDPVLPRLPDRTTILTPSPQQETTPDKEGIPPYHTSPTPESPGAPQPDKQSSPLDFLTMPTPLTPEETQRAPRVESEPGKQLSPLDFLPMPTQLAPDKTQNKSKAEKDTQPGKARSEEPKPQPPLKAEQDKPKSGDPLRIPPESAKTGDLSFLEGCWRTPSTPSSGRLPDIDWRFCFDKNGIGKRTTQLPKEGTCTGAAKGYFDAHGRLIITNEPAYCTGSSLTIATPGVICEKKNGATLCNFGDPRKGRMNPQTFPLIRE